VKYCIHMDITVFHFFKKYFLTRNLRLFIVLLIKKMEFFMMDRKLTANNNIYGYWFYTYFALVCPLLRRTC
jgi:hypothetical protein